MEFHSLSLKRMDLKYPVPSQVWWSPPATLVLRNLRQEKQQSKTILGDKMSLRSAWVSLCQKGGWEERGKEREGRNGGRKRKEGRKKERERRKLLKFLSVVYSIKY